LVASIALDIHESSDRRSRIDESGRRIDQIVLIADFSTLGYADYDAKAKPSIVEG
jgi:hypothetical protein